MQIPPLIERADKRMLNVIVMKLPGTMNDGAVLINLIRSQLGAVSSAMWSNRHDVGRAVRKPDARTRKRNLHHVLRKVTRGMHHVLMSCRDAAARRVIVSAKVRRRATAARRGQKQREINSSLMIDDRLRRFDHHLHLERTRR